MHSMQIYICCQLTVEYFRTELPTSAAAASCTGLLMAVTGELSCALACYRTGSGTLGSLSYWGSLSY